MPDCTSADITGLHEKTDYLVRVVAVTEEYFDRLPDKHKHKKLHAIPRDVLVAQEESPWLPSASIIAKTAGTEAPANIRLSKSTMTSLVLTWTPPLVYGSNKLLSQVLCVFAALRNVSWQDMQHSKHSFTTCNLADCTLVGCELYQTFIHQLQSCRLCAGEMCTVPNVHSLIAILQIVCW